MIPKEKAKELIDKMLNETDLASAKECAIIAVDEIRNEKLNEGILSGYWYEVRREIQKL